MSPPGLGSKRRFGERLDVLGLPDFRRVFLAQSVSVFGDGITPVALTFAVLGLTGSGTDLGLVLAAQSLPLAALALVGGVWADRLPRQKVMVASDLTRATVQAVTAVLLLSGAAQVWQLALLAAVHGGAEAFFRPSAGALLPQIVPGASLQRANALMGMSDNFGWMVGPAVAGTLVAVVGAGGAIAVDAATFLVSAAFLAGVRPPTLARSRATQSFVAELRNGWREVRSRTWLWAMLLRACLVLCIVIAPFQVLGPLGLTQQGYTAAAWGWVTAVFSLGMIIGAAIAFRYRPERPMITVTLTGATALASPLVLALGGGPWSLGAVQAVRGIAIGVLTAVWNTALQTEIEDEALGRVVAWDWMSSLALWPAGLALAGPLAESLGVTTTSWLSFGLGTLAAFWVLGVRDVWRMRTRPRVTPAG
ncbi:MAG TPA: MFS transporter [Thermoleophilia bacterium]|nr:MFS transporter [Thermoleophilia bacterium]